MPTQKVFKQRVRSRMTKTGESYTTARAQLLRKAGSAEPAVIEPVTDDPAVAGSAPAAAPFSDAATIRATGRSQNEWYRLIDEAGIAPEGHTAIARWLVAEHGVAGWWAQSITVGYERARGLRALGQMADGFSVSATRTIATSLERALESFTSPDARAAWLPGVAMHQRRTTAKLSARFDWDEPPSRVAVGVAPKGEGRVLVYITHEKIADATAAERLRTLWRERLGVLKGHLEAEQPG